MMLIALIRSVSHFINGIKIPCWHKKYRNMVIVIIIIIFIIVVEEKLIEHRLS